MNIDLMLHSISTTAKTPVLWLLIVLLILTAFLMGSAIGEMVLRRKKKISLPDAMRKISESDSGEEILNAIREQGFTKKQQAAFEKVLKTQGMSEAMRTEAAQGVITEIEDHYSRIINYSELIIKIAPMAGLMGTLIPLGPGIMALGKGDTQILSESIITAFDTTVAGLISAGFATVVSTVRKLWYKKYIADSEAVIEALLEKLSEEAEKE